MTAPSEEQGPEPTRSPSGRRRSRRRPSETAGDALSMTLGLGYLASTGIFAAIFALSVATQGPVNASKSAGSTGTICTTRRPRNDARRLRRPRPGHRLRRWRDPARDRGCSPPLLVEERSSCRSPWVGDPATARRRPSYWVTIMFLADARHGARRLGRGLGRPGCSGGALLFRRSARPAGRARVDDLGVERTALFLGSVRPHATGSARCSETSSTSQWSQGAAMKPSVRRSPSRPRDGPLLIVPFKQRLAQKALNLNSNRRPKVARVVSGRMRPYELIKAKAMAAPSSPLTSARSR